MQTVNWKKNLWVLLFGTFMIGMAFNEVIPFMSLYIAQLGNYNQGQLSILSGVVYAASFFVVIFTAPMWGRFADKHGRKWMILQTSLGSAVSIAMMGLVTNVWQFILLRVLQGFFDGVIPNSIALVATETPKKRSEYALSLLSTGYVSGFLIGPIFGGFLVRVLSIRITFFLTGLLLLTFFILSLTMVKENYRPSPEVLDSKFSWNFMRGFPNIHFITWMLIISALVQTATNAVYPIITLYVKQLMKNQGPVTIIAGLITALPGIAMVMTSPFMGRYGDNKGTYRIAWIGFSIVTVCYFPQGFATSVLILGIFRFINGIGNAGVFPSIQTFLAKGTPHSHTGMAFSLNQAAQAVGTVLGSMVGGLISNMFNYNVTFYFSGIIMVITIILMKLKIPELKKY